MSNTNIDKPSPFGELEAQLENVLAAFKVMPTFPLEIEAQEIKEDLKRIKSLIREIRLTIEEKSNHEECPSWQ